MYDLHLLARAHAATDPMAPPECGRHLSEAYDAACSSAEATEESTIGDAQSETREGRLYPAAPMEHTWSMSFALWWWRHGIFPLTVLVMLANQLAAQSATSVEPGDRVRIESEEVSGEFTVVDRSSDALVVRKDLTKKPSTIRVDAVTKLEVSRGQRSWRGRGALAGLLVGAGVGAAIGHATYEEHPCAFFDLLCAQAPEDRAVFGAVLGLLPGAVIGAVIGNSLSREVWEDVPMTQQLRITPSAEGGVALGYTYSF